ncbi:hypothetical protein [Nonomuraea soli]|uniref:2,4-dienoyl-CoA reductase-like NADH-dependent reductase (Old Yellow Enzyme family) n=1 Tax=Nonomuraea soli TaxID=1032476 RepID=A0A7W0CGF3_9ACTN|nr:hypothetical protein [Nonomuraea soli]MBA2890715.1 2,4-dienoyl-CoA reductase-like NADH-dependent reductase (Old Yellow Enzyme family) [Nonomuraea soli]
MARRPRDAEALLTADADLISLGRTFLANPDLVTRLRRGAHSTPSATPT